jgi:hypothetical protein
VHIVVVSVYKRLDQLNWSDICRLGVECVSTTACRRGSTQVDTRLRRVPPALSLLLYRTTSNDQSLGSHVCPEYVLRDRHRRQASHVWVALV